MKEKTILIVDDSEFERGLLVKVLEKKTDFRIIEASSADQCLERLSSNHIDLILMDIMMPGIFGTQVLLKIREKFNPIELPIIMVTSKADASDSLNCFLLGANDYIIKPIHFDLSVARISLHLKLTELSREMSRLNELAALDAMIITYNHEINNPLAIALACLNGSLLKDEAMVSKLKSSLWRVADIVGKIKLVTEKREIEYQEYSELSKMVKI